uniref:Uncharacterized protein n=1 Tax=Rhipicephalus zambeziensis TaxID=60191 RepID=A0A224Y4W2_9ACAR
MERSVHLSPLCAHCGLARRGHACAHLFFACPLRPMSANLRQSTASNAARSGQWTVPISNDHLADTSATSNKISCYNMCTCLPEAKKSNFPFALQPTTKLNK